MKKQLDFDELKRKLTVETSGEFKNIVLTDEQYARLITILKIGLRVAACDRDAGVNVPLIDIDQYISSYAKHFNAEHLVENCEEYGGLYFSSEILGKAVDTQIKIYGGEFIRTELSHKLATRDFLKKLDNKSKKPMKDVFNKIKSSYQKEFDKNDLENVTIADEKARA